MLPTMGFYADPPTTANGTKNDHGHMMGQNIALRGKADISFSNDKIHSASKPNVVAKNDASSRPEADDYKVEIKWRNVIMFAYLHIAAIYGFTLPKTGSSIVIGWLIGILSGFGTTVGSHRLFTHRTFKANKQLRVLMMFLQTMAGQEPVLKWARDHRVHHKFTDTNADPYNSRRGFFFAHIGWLMCKKHPEVLRQGKKVDMSDLENDPVLKFQQKYYIPMAIFLTFVFPIWIACYFGESFHVAYYGNLYRYMLGLNVVWMVNSVAHLWGPKPYDKSISPTDTYLVGFCALGEGWHNYHHIFPWDYKTAELPGYMFNISTSFIDFLAWIGWATELKTVPDNIIKDRILRTGDGSHDYSKLKVDGEENNNHGDGSRDVEHFWGFGDKEMSLEDMQYVKIIKK